MQAMIRGQSNTTSGHKAVPHTVRYTELTPTRFKDFWRWLVAARESEVRFSALVAIPQGPVQSNGGASPFRTNAGHFSAHLWRLKVQRQQRHR